MGSWSWWMGCQVVRLGSHTTLKWPYHVAAATYHFYIAEVKGCDQKQKKPVRFHEPCHRGSAWVKEGPITFWCRLRSLFENNGIKGIDLVGNALSKCPSSLIILWSNHCAHGNCQSCGFFHPLQHQSCYFKSMLSKHRHDGAWTLYSYRLTKRCWLHVFQRIIQ